MWRKLNTEIDMKNLRQELIDFTNWYLTNIQNNTILHNTPVESVDLYLKSINSNASPESRNVRTNEQARKDFSHELLHHVYIHMMYVYCPLCGLKLTEKSV